MPAAKWASPYWRVDGYHGYVRRGQARHPNELAESILASENHPIALDRSYRDRESRLAQTKDRWIKARPGREVVVARGASERHIEQWVAVFVEDDKGIVSVQGRTWAEALERAIALLGLSVSGEDG